MTYSSDYTCTAPYSDTTMLPIFASLISTPLLTKVAIFGAVACWRLVAARHLLARQTARRTAARRLPRPIARRSDGRDGSRGVTKRADGMARLLERASPAMAKPLQPKSGSRRRQAAREAELCRLPQRSRPEHLPRAENRLPADRLLRRRRRDVLHQGRDHRNPDVHRRHRRRRVLPAGSRSLVLQASRAKTTSSSACPMRST